MKNVLVYYSFGFAPGGAEYLPLALLASLQKKCKVTLAVDVAANIERSCRVFGEGLDIDLSKLQVVQVTPSAYNPRRHSILVSLYRFRKLKRLAKSADACISAANIMDFGRPAHHFINAVAFGDSGFTAFAAGSAAPGRTGALKRAGRFLADSVMRPLLGMRTKRSIICNRRERIYPNSRYVEAKMAEYYGPFNSAVFYPPVAFEPKLADVARDPMKVVYIGRVIPEKRLTEMIEIVGKAREATGLDLRFHIAGRLDQVPSYGNELRAMAAQRSWICLEGALYGEEKERFLLSASYALHAERIEAFGIAVAEYLKAGVVAIVPDEGGSYEVVDNPDLSYHTIGEAAAILARLLTDEPFRSTSRARCAARAKDFSQDAYLARQDKLLGSIVGENKNA